MPSKRAVVDLHLGTVGFRSVELAQYLNSNEPEILVLNGDIFDITMKRIKWVAKIGGKGYDLLILLNGAVNYLFNKLGKDKISLSKRIKNSVKKAFNLLMTLKYRLWI